MHAIEIQELFQLFKLALQDIGRTHAHLQGANSDMCLVQPLSMQDYG